MRMVEKKYIWDNFPRTNDGRFVLKRVWNRRYRM